MDVITAKTIARRDGCKTVTDWIKKAALRRNVRVSPAVCDAQVVARIDHGRWIADCECKGAEYVDPDEPVFFCFSCLNAGCRGALRPVKFPPAEIREQIETTLSEENYNSWNEEEEPYEL